MPDKIGCQTVQCLLQMLHVVSGPVSSSVSEGCGGRLVRRGEARILAGWTDGIKALKPTCLGQVGSVG